MTQAPSDVARASVHMTITDSMISTAPATGISVAARTAAGCAVAFLFALIALHLLRTDLDPTWRPISEYAIGPHGWLMTTCFALWGTGPIALAIAVRKEASTRAAQVGLALLVLGAFGPLLAAAFPMDPLGTAPDAMSGSGMVHAASAVLGDLIPIAALVLGVTLTRDTRIWATSRNPVRVAAALAFGLLVLGSVAVGIMMPENGELGPEVRVGWLMRAFVVASNLWVGVAAWATTQRTA